MNATSEQPVSARAGLAESEAFPDLVTAAHWGLEQGDALEAYRAFDDGAFSEVPYALERYMRHQRLGLN